MIIEKMSTKIGLRITFDSPIIYKEETENFGIIQNGSSFFYNQAIVNEKTVELFITDDPTLPDEEQKIFSKEQSFTVFINTKSFIATYELVYEQLNLIGTNVDIDSSLNDFLINELEFDFDLVKNENDELVLFIEHEEDSELIDTNFNILVKSYELSSYEDFPDSLKKFSLPFSENEIKLDFVKDKIYTIEISHSGGSKYSSTKKKKVFLPFKPNIYLSSLYQIKALLAELEIEINLFTGLESQLQIWKFSQLAFVKSGLLDEDLIKLTSSEKTVFSNYVAYKIVLQKFMSSFLALHLEQTNSPSNEGVKGLKLGDFSVSSLASSQETINSLNTVLRNLDNEIREISFRKAFSSSEKIHFSENRASLLGKRKVSLIKTNKQISASYFRNWWE